MRRQERHQQSQHTHTLVLYLSLCLSSKLFVCLSVCLFVSLDEALTKTPTMSVCLFVWLCLPLCLSFVLFVCFIFLSLYLWLLFPPLSFCEVPSLDHLSVSTLVACTRLYNLLCPSVCPSAGQLVPISLFYRFRVLWPHCSCPNALVTLDTAPAHPQGTGVAVNPALFRQIVKSLNALWSFWYGDCSLRKVM